MKTARFFGIVSLFIGSLTLVACEGDKEEPGESTFAEKSPEERVGAVEQGVEEPSGEVDSESAPDVLVRSQAEAKFDAWIEFFGGVPGLSDGALSATWSIGGSTDGSLDLGCSSDGELSGEMVYEVSASATTQLVKVMMKEACDADTCLDGSLVVSVDTAKTGEVSTIIQGSVDVTADGETTHSEWGISATVGLTGTTETRVVFDGSGDSYVVSASVQGESSSGKVTIQGANGEFSCEYTDGGAAGSCSGSGSFEW